MSERMTGCASKSLEGQHCVHWLLDIRFKLCIKYAHLVQIRLANN
jgi:hypothetical protein